MQTDRGQLAVPSSVFSFSLSPSPEEPPQPSPAKVVVAKAAMASAATVRVNNDFITEETIWFARRMRKTHSIFRKREKAASRKRPPL